MRRVAFGVLAVVLGCGSQVEPSESPPRAAVASVPKASTPPEPANFSPPALADRRGAHARIQTRQLRTKLEPSPLVHDAPIHNARALDRFHDALIRLSASEDPGTRVRIAVYGSSSVAGDRITGYMRGYLQVLYGDAGPGFVALVPLWRWHRHQEVETEASRGWKVAHALRPGPDPDDRYGLMGVRSTASTVGATIDTRLRRGVQPALRWEIWALGGPRGGTLTARLDEDPPVELTTARDKPGPVYLKLSAGSPRSRLRIRTGGRVGLFGAVIERDARGVIVDELGIGGSGAKRQLRWNEPLWTEHLRRRSPALYVLAYGGIGAMGPDFDQQRWQDQLEQLLDRFERATPDASCLLIAPQDLALRSNGGARERPPALDGINAALRSVIESRNCALFEIHAVMGGPGTMPAWVAAKLAMKDHVHLTPAGYAHVGRALADALLERPD